MTKYIFILAAIATLGLTSCDHVENPYPPSINVDLDTTIYNGNWSTYLADEWPDFSTIPSVDPLRNVLLEDYTGHNCSNCPAAGTEAHNIHDANKTRIFTLGVHSSPVGMSSFQEVNTGAGYTVDFTNPEGLTIGQHFGEVLQNTGFYGNPSGMINRTNNAGEYFSAMGSWSTKSNDQLATSLKVGIKAKVNYFEDTKGFFLHTEIEKLDASVTNELGVVVVLVEDSLVGPQNVNGTKVDDYVHRDIMRGHIDNQAWGRTLTSAELTDDKYYVDYSYSVPNQLAPQGVTGTYNADNMHLLIYVYDKTTLEIYQVIKKHIVE